MLFVRMMPHYRQSIMTGATTGKRATHLEAMLCSMGCLPGQEPHLS